MTVAQLIAELQKLPDQDETIFIQYVDETTMCWTEVAYVEHIANVLSITGYWEGHSITKP